MKADHIVEALTGDSGWKHMIPQVDSSDFPTQWVPSAYECSIIEAQAKEIEKLRGQNKQLREAAALVTKESAKLLEMPGDILELKAGCLKDGISHRTPSPTGCRCRNRRR